MKIGDCKHFNGLPAKTCRGGITYDNGKRSGNPLLVLPCIQDEDHPIAAKRNYQGTGVHCTSFCALTKEDVEAANPGVDVKAGERLSECCMAPRDRSRLIASGPYKGSGWIHCSKCGKALSHVHGKGH